MIALVGSSFFLFFLSFFFSLWPTAVWTNCSRYSTPYGVGLGLAHWGGACGHATPTARDGLEKPRRMSQSASCLDCFQLYSDKMVPFLIESASISIQRARRVTMVSLSVCRGPFGPAFLNCNDDEHRCGGRELANARPAAKLLPRADSRAAIGRDRRRPRVTECFPDRLKVWKGHGGPIDPLSGAFGRSRSATGGVSFRFPRLLAPRRRRQDPQDRLLRACAQAAAPPFSPNQFPPTRCGRVFARPSLMDGWSIGRTEWIDRSSRSMACVSLQRPRPPPRCYCCCLLLLLLLLLLLPRVWPD